MTLRPFSATLQQQFRDTLGTPGAPEVIDDGTPVMPVAVVATVNTASSASYVQVSDGTDTMSVNTDGSINVAVIEHPASRTLFSYAAIANIGAGTTLRTPAAGKKLYVTHISFTANGAGTYFTVLDNATVKYNVNLANTANSQAAFPSPIEFSTNLIVDADNANSNIYTIVGYEE